jgi:L-seryl-tRNA(Ser) seleniumtransferase
MLQSLPSIDQVLLSPEASKLCAAYSRELVVWWAREAVAELREELLAGGDLPRDEDGKVTREVVTARLLAQAERLLSPSLRRAVNATGIVIHTNLGRAPLSPELMDSMRELLGSYSNLEFDLDSGQRGSRHVHLARLIRAVTGAEDGLVVNNNAAAVMVALHTLAAGREVVVSRGELIEIGGSFRMPDIIAASGAIIREVGTTNKTRLRDYERAINDNTGLLLKVHPSNYRIVGFTEEAALSELAVLGRMRGLPVMVDIGSGLLVDLKAPGLESEPAVRWYLEAGADLVTFSGDKLLGGPQAGFIAGRADLVAAIKQDPMVRALRVGKLTIAGLETLLTTYLSPQTALERLPALQLLTRPAHDLLTEANRLARDLRKKWPQADIKVSPDESFAGGGALPAVPLPTYVVTVALPSLTAEELARAFRSAAPPVVGRIGGGLFRIDCRTLLPGDAALIVEAAGAMALPDAVATFADALAQLPATLSTTPTPAATRKLQDYVKAKLLPYKYPREVTFIDELPKTGTGKIDRQALLRM